MIYLTQCDSSSRISPSNAVMRSTTAAEICAPIDRPSRRQYRDRSLLHTSVSRADPPAPLRQYAEPVTPQTQNHDTQCPGRGGALPPRCAGGPRAPPCGKTPCLSRCCSNAHIDLPILVTPTSTEPPRGRRCRRYVPGVRARVQKCPTNSNGDQTVRGPSISHRREIVPKNTSEQICVSPLIAERPGVFGRNLREKSATTRGTR